ncbi:MAG: hypothetical protein ACI4HM_04035, partial [Ruminococcus sp.]
EDCRNGYEKITEQMELPTNIDDINNLKKARRKDRINLIIGITATILFFSLVFVLVKPYFPYLYGGDRITLSIRGEIDDEKIQLNQEDVACKYEDDSPQEISFEETDKYIISTKGDEYGGYEFTICTGDNNIVVDFIHTNWWKINDIDFAFRIDSYSKTIVYKIDDSFDSVKYNEKTNSYYVYYMI